MLLNSEEIENAKRNAAYRDAVLKELQPMLEPALYELVEIRSAPLVKRRAKKKISLRHALIMMAALIASSLILNFYITMRADVDQRVKHISQLQAQLNTLQTENNDNYENALSKVSLDEIRDIALNEYGMQYAEEGQIVSYQAGERDDYVEQVGQIPGVK